MLLAIFGTISNFVCVLFLISEIIITLFPLQVSINKICQREINARHVSTGFIIVSFFFGSIILIAGD